MSMTLSGSCHCGAVHIAFEPSRAPAELPLRACQCGFCRRHGARTTSDPESRLLIAAAPGAIAAYRFGRRVSEVLICRMCGCYIASAIEGAAGKLATLNAAGVDLEGFDGRAAEPANYEDETDEARLARRLARWTPTTFAPAVPNA